GRSAEVVMSVPQPKSTGSSEKWQEHERVRVQPGSLAHVLGQREIALRFGLVAEVQVKRGQAIVAGEQELRLARLRDQAERLPVALEGARGVAVALVDLAQHDERDSEVVELTELPVELDGGLRCLDALGLAAIRERA